MYRVSVLKEAFTQKGVGIVKVTVSCAAGAAVPGSSAFVGLELGRENSREPLAVVLEIIVRQGRRENYTGFVRGGRPPAEA